ncbi:MAG TPA: hypothetical protein VJ891_18480 [Casimicrobiaceae bacterium]|nr:hypothetical protein [Casimicrobiaceae bacterium]
MRLVQVVPALVALALGSATLPAAAIECYVIVDRANEVIYQGTLSPIDLSDDGTAARNALRARGQQFIAMDTPSCPAIDRMRVGNDTANVDEIVAGMRSVPYSRTRGTRTAPAQTGIQLPAITVPRDTGGGMSVGGPVSGMSIR